MDVPVEKDARWAHIAARNAAMDGQFWYSVSSTRVYCRPSCPSRTAHPRFVRIHNTLEEARATGYRPCGRCRPEQPSLDEQHHSLVAQACALIADSADELPLGALAAMLNRSPTHLHRIFKTITGLTPKAYQAARRAELLRRDLPSQQAVTTALYDAGFGSSGQFYAQARQQLGMRPAQYRTGAPNETLHFALGECSLGTVLVASSAQGIAVIDLGDDPLQMVRALQARFRRAALIGDDAEYQQLVARVIGLIEAPQFALELPLDIRGTLFQQQVWQVLRTIPPGQTVTYAELARLLGRPRATRAVATACAANPLAVAIPCHRVVREDGSPWGYRWGIARKEELLKRER